MMMEFNTKRFTVKDGKTVMATLDLDALCGNQDETFDGVMLNALGSIQSQLLDKKVEVSKLYEVIRSAIPYLGDMIRPKKRKTASYREFKLKDKFFV